jgi:hypothetical protein
MKLVIPTDWSDITIGVYQELYAVLKMSDGIVLEKDIKMLSIVTGVSEEIIGTMSVEIYSDLMQRMTFILTLPKSDNIPLQIKFDGIKYNLQMRVEKLTLAQYIDLETLSKTPDEIIYNLHKILAVFMNNDKVYNTDAMLRRADIFKAKMTMDIAYPIAVFFYLNYMSLLNATISYLEIEAKKQVNPIQQKLPTTTTRGGNGILFWKN